MAKKDILVASPATATGGILGAPLGSTTPTDTVAAVDAAFEPHGYVGEDGLSMAIAKSIEKIRAWGGDTVRNVQTEHDVTFTFTLLETSEASAKAVFGDANVTVTAADTTSGNKLDITVTSDPLPEKAWVFDMKDGKKRVRVVVPNGQITETGDTQFVHSNATGWECTLEATPDENGVKAYIYSDDGETTAV